MPATLALPVSTVTEEWFDGPFCEAVASAIKQRAVGWIIVEHADEGDILIERLGRSMRKLRSLEFEFSPSDPALAWQELVGTGDEPGLLGSLHGNDVLFIRGGAHLHHELLALWRPVLEAMSAGAQCAIISSLHRRTAQDAPHLIAHGCVRIDVPEFKIAPLADRLALARELLEDACDRAPPPEVAEVLLEREPASRTELERWVEACADSASAAPDGTVDVTVVSQLPRLHSHPKRLRSRALLAAEFKTICSFLDVTDRAYADWRGMRLFAPVRGPVEPFATRDPRGWFIATSSYAACQYFDACDPVVFSLCELILTPDGRLAFDAPPGFLRDLRALRTYFQHGLDWNSDKDRDTRDAVVAWFRHRCGADEPRPEDWRDLCDALLHEWRDLAARVAHVTERAVTAPNRQQVEVELDKIGGRLPEHRWQELVRAVAAPLGLSVDTRAFVRVHLSQMVEAVRRAAPMADSIERTARALVEERLLALSAVAPVGGDDFIAAGLEPGRQVGNALKLARTAWAKDPSLSKEHLVAYALRTLGASAPPKPVEPSAAAPGVPPPIVASVPVSNAPAATSAASEERAAPPPVVSPPLHPEQTGGVAGGSAEGK